MKRNNQRGVGMIEIMVVLIVLGIGIIAIAGLQTNLFSGSTETKARAEALNLAKAKIEELKAYSAWGPTGTATCTGDGQYRCNLATGTFTDTYAGINALFTRSWTIADETSTATTTNALKAKSGAKYLIATVSWTGPDGTSQSVELDTFMSFVSPANAVLATLGPEDTNTSAHKAPGGGGQLGMQEGTEDDTRTNTSVYDDRGTTDTSDDLYMRTNSEGGMELIEGTGTNTNVVMTSYGNKLATIKGRIYSADANWVTATSTYTATDTGSAGGTVTLTGMDTSVGAYKVNLIATTPSVCSFGTINNCSTGLGTTCAASLDYTCIVSGDCTNGGKNGTATATATINIVNNTPSVNDLPVANPDSYYVAAGGTLSGNVLDNDFDADASNLRVWAALAEDTSTSAGTTQQGHVITIGADGAFSIDLSSNSTFTGTDGFVYKITDAVSTDTSSSTSTALGTVTFNVVNPAAGNDLPVAVSNTYHVLVGGALTKNVISNDFDADGDALTINSFPATAPTRGSLSLSSGGRFTYRPTGTATGTDAFTYTLSEGNGCPAVATASLPSDPGGKYNGGWYGKIGIIETVTSGTSKMVVCQGDTGDLDVNTPSRFYVTERWSTSTSTSTLTGYEGINSGYQCHDFLLLTAGNPTPDLCPNKLIGFGLAMADSDIRRSLSGTDRNYAQPTDSYYCTAVVVRPINVNVAITGPSNSYDYTALMSYGGSCTAVDTRDESVCSYGGNAWTGDITVTGTDGTNICTGTSGALSYISGTYDVAINCQIYRNVTTTPVQGVTYDPPTQSVVNGTSASVTITAAVGYTLNGVSGSGCTVTRVGASSVYTTSALSTNCVITANATGPVTVTPEVVGSGGINPSTAVTLTTGQTQAFTLTPDTGFGLQGVTGCGGAWTPGSLSYTTGPLTEDCTVTATFVRAHTVTLSAGSGGRIADPATPTVALSSVQVLDGATRSFTITPDTNYILGTVSGCDGNLSGNSYTTGPITGPCTVTASFIPTYDLSISGSISGNINVGISGAGTPSAPTCSSTTGVSYSCVVRSIPTGTNFIGSVTFTVSRAVICTGTKTGVTSQTLNYPSPGISANQSYNLVLKSNATQCP